MLKYCLFFIACLCIPIVISWGGLMLGPGEWLVEHIGHCENPETYELVLDVIRKKINRTHDSYTFIFELEKEFNSSYGILVDIFKEVDGGYKYFQTMSDKSACGFVKKYSEANLRRALSLANIDPPDCPFGPGPIIIPDFVMDYTKLARNSVYGTFLAYTFITYEKKKIFCLKVILNFDKRNDD